MRKIVLLIIYKLEYKELFDKNFAYLFQMDPLIELSSM